MTRAKGPRGLTPEDKVLWEQIKKRTRPLKPEALKSAEPKQKLPPRPTPADRQSIPKFELGASAKPKSGSTRLVPPVESQIGSEKTRMDKKSHKRMVQGKLKPEARLDLHGLTQEAAFSKLHQFIAQAYANNYRLVLVITGKGKHRQEDGPIPARHGVLRHAVPDWLRSPGLAPMVLQVRQAHQRHGGSGALYVYLSRRRAT